MTDLVCCRWSRGPSSELVGIAQRSVIELTDAVAAAIAGPKIDVQLDPAGVQWCSRPLLEAVAENSAATGRRIHMHLLETIYQRVSYRHQFQFPPRSDCRRDRQRPQRDRRAGNRGAGIPRARRLRHNRS